MIAFGHFWGEGRAGLPDSKDEEEHCLLWLGYISSRICKDDQISNTLCTLVNTKSGFKKSSSKESKIKGWGQGQIEDRNKQKQILLQDGFP